MNWATQVKGEIVTALQNTEDVCSELCTTPVPLKNAHDVVETLELKQLFLWWIPRPHEIYTYTDLFSNTNYPSTNWIIEFSLSSTPLFSSSSHTMDISMYFCLNELCSLVLHYWHYCHTSSASFVTCVAMSMLLCGWVFGFTY